MKKLLKIGLAAAVISTMFMTNVDANNLAIDVKGASKRGPEIAQSLAEIQDSIAYKTVDSDACVISIKPQFHQNIVSGEVISLISKQDNITFERTKSYAKNGVNGHLIAADGPYVKDEYGVNAVKLLINNKTAAPLIIDLNKSSLTLRNESSTPALGGKVVNVDNKTQPTIVIPPNAQNYELNLLMGNFKFNDQNLKSSWLYVASEADFNNIPYSLALNVNDKYVLLHGAAAIPQEIQSKYDLEKLIASQKTEE